MKIETSKGEVEPKSRTEAAKVYLAVFGGTIFHNFVLEAASLIAFKLAIVVLSAHISLPWIGDNLV